MKRTTLSCFLALLCFCLPLPSASAEDDMWSKLGRGFANITFGPLEVFHQAIRMGQGGERWMIAVFGGMPKGVFVGAGRMLIGVYEVLTFPVPGPNGYEAIIEPEFIIPEAERL